MIKQRAIRFAIKKKNEYLNEHGNFGPLIDADLYSEKPQWNIISPRKVVQVSVTIEELPYEI